MQVLKGKTAIITGASAGIGESERKRYSSAIIIRMKGYKP